MSKGVDTKQEALPTDNDWGLLEEQLGFAVYSRFRALQARAKHPVVTITEEAVTHFWQAWTGEESLPSDAARRAHIFDCLGSFLLENRDES